MSDGLRIVVVGADGLIGHALCARLTEQGNVAIGTSRRRGRTGDGGLYLDLAAPSLPDMPQADVAVICAAMAKFSECRGNPPLARQVNVIGAVMLARRFIERGTRVVRLSSSAVFDGKHPKVVADTPTGSLSVYGQIQAEAERAMLALGPMATVLRLTKVVTPAFPVVRAWLAALAEGGCIEAFTDHRISPISLRCAVDAIVAVVQQREGGIFQVSGGGDISYVEFAYHLVERLGLPRERVVPIRAAQKGVPSEEVTGYTSMDTSRLTALTGFVAPEPFSVFDQIFDAELDRLRCRIAV